MFLTLLRNPPNLLKHNGTNLAWLKLSISMNLWVTDINIKAIFKVYDYVSTLLHGPLPSAMLGDFFDILDADKHPL